MICTPRIKCKDVPLCVDNLTIGDTSLRTQEVKVIFHNVATDAKMIVTGQSDANGLITVDVSEINFLPAISYIISVVNPTTLEPYEVTIGTQTEEEIILQFVDLKDEDYDCETFNSFTLVAVE